MKWWQEGKWTRTQRLVKVVKNSWEAHVLPKVINNIPACSKTWGLSEFYLVFIYLCTVSRWLNLLKQKFIKKLHVPKISDAQTSKFHISALSLSLFHMCANIFTYMYTITHIHNIHIQNHSHSHVYTHNSIYTYTQIHSTHTCIHLHIDTYINVYIHKYTYPHPYSHCHTHILLTCLPHPNT